MVTVTKSNGKTGREPPARYGCNKTILQCVGYWIRSLTSEQTAHPSHLHGVLRFQRAFSLLESNLVSVGVLPWFLGIGHSLGQDAVRAIGQPVDALQLFGIARKGGDRHNITMLRNEVMGGPS
jgi:hypothetical protein